MTEEPSPLAVILKAMRVAYEKKNWAAAAAFARLAAPYVHGRSAARPATDLSRMQDAELDAQLAADGANPPPPNQE